MNTYLAIKYLHMSCAVLSIAGFTVRGALRLADAAILRQRWLRIAPHCVDTLLLISALWLVLQSRQYPFVAPWLTAKLVALVVYIILGIVTMRLAQRTSTRLGAYLLALLTASYIVAVALTRNPWPCAGPG
ncbi:MAG TPA: SirB2 family protein [Spongiibacteraceae bacterium]|jgi:uncharacterized membrane protein SirB2|nr:SirB2 family protein [Spongiibacteraceae bacterium]HUH39201.1 SirB2 family protein [Spongiibacteraceae bacterium]